VIGLKQRLVSGALVIGTTVNAPAPSLVEAAGWAGFDYVVIDGEHGTIGVRECEEMVRAAEAAGVPAIVRVPTNAPHVIQSFLETGATGIQVPQVNTAAEAERAVASAHYAPRGRRGLAGSRPVHFTIDRTLVEHVAASVDRTVVIVQAEDVAAVPAIAEICAVPDLDALFIGPADLSQSLGLPGQLDATAVKDAIKRIEAAARGARKPLATSVRSIDAARAAHRAGYQVVTIVALSLFGDAARSFIRGVRADA
jgi:4-hydroxy-2-oxoheptanedioate aldolase